MATATLYLDTRRIREDGTAQIKVAVNHKGKTAFIATNVCVTPKQWNKDKQCIIGHPAKIVYNNRLSEILQNVRNALLDLTMSNRLFLNHCSATELRDKVLDMQNPAKDEVKQKETFGERFLSFISRHSNERTKEIYRATYIKIEKYDKSLLKISFDDITKDVLESFFVWMEKDSPSVNARNIHLRNIRAVFNDAIDNNITQNYPFRRLKIRPEQTAKRNLSPELIARIFFGRYKEWQQRYVDAFNLSFLLIGINMVDLLNLPKTALQDGRIVYNRAKTKKLYSIKVEPEAMQLIRKYEGKDRLLSFAENNNVYKTFAMKMNNCLGRIEKGVTAYYARHSWATIAASLDIPKDTIAAALGHGGNSVTDIYIEFDKAKVDRANRMVIDKVYAYK